MLVEHENVTFGVALDGHISLQAQLPENPVEGVCGRSLFVKQSIYWYCFPEAIFSPEGDT